jgi:Myb-like DNA-binding domain
LKRSAWTKQEDETILRLQEQGKGWPEIADKLRGRNAEQVNDRFSNHIDPTLNMAPLTKEEASILKEEVEKYKKKINWVEIVKLFPGRSRDKLKNWWYNSKKSKQRPPPMHGDDVKETTKKRRVENIEN